MLWSAFPYSYYIVQNVHAYAEIRLFVLMYLVCSRCIPTDFPVWPTYESLHVLYFSLYMRLEFYFIEWYSIAEFVVYGVVSSKSYSQVTIF